MSFSEKAKEAATAYVDRHYSSKGYDWGERAIGDCGFRAGAEWGFRQAIEELRSSGGNGATWARWLEEKLK